MNIKQWIQGEITIKPYHANFLIISGMMFILLLYTVWPRFRNDAMSIDWYWYLILMIIFGVPSLGKVLTELKK